MLVAFDIETGPLPDDLLPAFDRDSVKLGNLRDPEKIEAKLEAAEEEFASRFALFPMTGRVLCIGWQEVGDQPRLFDQESERDLLQSFWIDWHQHKAGNVVGHNIFGFDLPFLCRRSLIVGVDIPPTVIDRRGYWHESFVDLMKVWQFGNRQDYVKLEALGQAFELGGKTEGVSGADFASLWESDRSKATEYVFRDVELTLQIAEAMGV